MSSPWDVFPDAPDAQDDWSGFPDAETPASDKPRRQANSNRVAPTIVTGVVDGDTMRTDTANARLYGVDAPELRQQGYMRDGTVVPIGEQSRDHLSGAIDNTTNVSLGDPVSWHFARPVTTMDLDGEDAGQMMARSGHALAAPEYLEDDPERRFQYMQAERLARLNGLGMHDVDTQTPAEFRDEPKFRPTARQTVPVFIDTPTPNAGLRPEVEERALAMIYSEDYSIDEVMAFGKANGAKWDPANLREARAFYLERGEAAGLQYIPADIVMTEVGDGKTGAAIRGAGSGFLASGLDEVGAFADMLGGTEGRESIWNSDRRAADIWLNNQQQNAAILRYDRNEYPNTVMASEIGGAVASGFVIPYGAGARTVGALAKVGAVYGGAEGFLRPDGGMIERTKGAIIGAPIGAAVNAVGGKALQLAAPHVARGAAALSENVRNWRGALPDDVPTGNTADEWAEFPDAPEAPAGTMAMAAEGMESVSSSASKPTGLLDDLTEAQMRAASDNVTPGDVLPMPSNQVDGVEEAASIDAGRVVEAKVPNERTALQNRTVRNFMGVSVPKVGPTDLVGWTRLNGGLIDAGDKISKGGDLKAMGITNAARRGMDFVGQEARFGPMVNNETGMALDDAALGAWEAGYFPELSERPTVNQFLEAIRETHEGGQRRFLPDDFREIDEFYGIQRERVDLDQQRSEEGGPIWRDNSYSPDDPAPLPPVEAYTDWGPNAPDFAGNIRLGKLESPQDIARALSQTERRVGFDAATRGRVTQEETARLAGELNMTAEQLLKRRKGQALNAEEALAARQILAKSGNELVNAARRVRGLGEHPGAEALVEFRQKWTRHVAIQEQVSGMTAEAGRALQQFRQTASARLVRGDVLDSLVLGGGGKGNLQAAAGALIDAAEAGPGVFNAVADKIRKPKWRDKIGEFYINFLLSNPPTHVVNMTGNTLTILAQVPEYAAGAVIGRARQVFSRNPIDRIVSSEVGARAFGLIQGTREGARLFARALKTGEADDFVSKVEGSQFHAIDGRRGKLARIPTRLLTAEDQLFKGIARRMELNAQAVRITRKEGLKGDAAQARIAELVAEPTDAMYQRALDYGRYLTFQRKLGDFGQSVSRGTASNLLAKIIVPFVRTPINLMKFATERSPAAPLLAEWRKEFLAGGASRDMAMAKVMLGTGFATVIYQAALSGIVTGALPPDPAKARLMRADGWQPYSIKVGDRYISYSRLDPFSTTIGVAADMATLSSGMSDRQAEEKGMLLVASIMNNLASKTWLSGISDFTSALDDPARNAENWIERVAGSFGVPAGVAGVARAMDPIQRQREGVRDAIQARIPGLSDNLLPRRDIFGEPVETDSLGPDLISPFWQTQAQNDPVIAEMLRIGKSVSNPNKRYTEDGETVDYSPEDYDRYHEIAGRLTYNALNDLVTSSDYQGMTDQTRRNAAKNTMTAARRTARGEIDSPNYQLPARGAAAQDEWSAFPDADGGDEWDAFEDAPQRDVVGSLERAIPGVGMTSGYRTPEYQDDMRARGYDPAENSAHLDGSSLDLTPPSGKSMRWLAARVRRAEPDANILNEGDHLHVTFPDWYGAPAIGGARSAGLVNPMARAGA